MNFEWIPQIIVVLLSTIGTLVMLIIIEGAVGSKIKQWKIDRHYDFKEHERVIICWKNKLLICSVDNRKIEGDHDNRMYRITPCVDLYDVCTIGEVRAIWHKQDEIRQVRWR